jgi:hypothetical protein
MSASQILLAGRDQEDRWLSESPDRTYFEAKYPTRVNRSRESFELPFDNQPTYDTTGRCTITPKGDFLTGLTLRTILPAIYPTQSGEYVFPTPSSQVGANVYVNKSLTQVNADGVTLTANTVGNHYFSIGAAVTLKGTAYNIFDLDGTYTISSIPTSNSFTCATSFSGLSYNGTVSTVGIACADVISYFSTQNSNLWVDNLTNKTWQITTGSNVGTVWTFTTSAPSNFPIGSKVVLNLPSSGIVNQICTTSASSDTTFTCTLNGRFVAVSGSSKSAYSSDNGLTWSFSPISSDYWISIAYGNGTFVTVGLTASSTAYSTDNGQTWNPVSLSGSWEGVTYGNGTFVTVGSGSTAYSTNNGQTWTPVSLSGSWYGVAYGNGTFVTVGNGSTANSITNGQTWTPVSLSGIWFGVAYGNGRFVTVGYGTTANSITNGQTWTSSSLSGTWLSVAYGNGTFVAVGDGLTAYSSNGQTWTTVSLSGTWYGVAYGNGTFVAVSYGSTAYSTNNGQTWTVVLFTGNGGSAYWGCIAFGFLYSSSLSDSVSLVVPPVQVSDRVFSSSAYSSISFANAADAAFWGFDARQGLKYSLPATPPWTLTQSGWIAGFLPPSLSTYVDSVAHKLCKAVRIKIGKQTIKEFTGEYIELQNDLWVPYENKAILKLLNGTLDQTQSVAAREYYVRIPMGAHEYPLCALTQQQLSISIDFEQYSALSDNLNQGSGQFTDSKSFTPFEGLSLNVQTTFSYQKYIFIVTYSGQFIIYDTTKDFTDPTSYTILSAFSGFKKFCVLSGTLYIGLTNGQLARFIIDELIQGNTSSFTVNNYAPTIGSLTGTIVSDFRYVYYAVSNTATSNVFVTQYDTTGTFTSSSSYKTVDFTQNFNSSVTGVYEFISTGVELVMIPQGLPEKLYTFQLNANVQSQWYMLDYSTYGYQITEGVLIGSVLYFEIDNFNILTYTNSVFTLVTFLPRFVSGGNGSDVAYSLTNGKNWIYVQTPGSYIWYGTAYGNETFVVVGQGGTIAYSVDYGKTWNISISFGIPSFKSVAFGNGIFIAVNAEQVASSTNGSTWTLGPYIGSNYWDGIAYGDGTFVTVGYGTTAYSINDGQTWTTVSLSGSWTGIAYGNGTFVAVGNGSTVNSITNGQTWTTVSLSGSWTGVAYGNGTFVAVGNGSAAYSTNDGQTWTTVSLTGSWNGVTYENGTFVAVGNNLTAYSTNDGHAWKTYASTTLNCVTAGTPKFTIPGDGFRNLIAVGNYIYCSTNSVAVQIDTTKDLSTQSAYQIAPLSIGQYIMANGPRYVYLFSQGSTEPIYRFDPYAPNTTFQVSIIADYESLPDGTPKPDKALVPITQTQKVTDMNYMDIHGPVKELFIVGASSSTNVFQYSNLSNQSTLAFTAGEQIVTDDVGTRTFLKTIQAFETHTAMPIRNLSIIPFELDPESETPNGTVNFSRIKDQVFSGDARTVWARTYNILAIQGGLGGLIFNS